MVEKYEFIERSVYLLRKALEEKLPKDATLDEMCDLRQKIIKEIF